MEAGVDDQAVQVDGIKFVGLMFHNRTYPKLYLGRKFNQFKKKGNLFVEKLR